jgi:hypothetical protein
MHLTGAAASRPRTRVPAAADDVHRGRHHTAIGVLGTDDVVRTTAELVAVTAGL